MTRKQPDTEFQEFKASYIAKLAEGLKSEITDDEVEAEVAEAIAWLEEYHGPVDWTRITKTRRAALLKSCKDGLTMRMLEAWSRYMRNLRRDLGDRTVKDEERRMKEIISEALARCETSLDTELAKRAGS